MHLLTRPDAVGAGGGGGEQQSIRGSLFSCAAREGSTEFSWSGDVGRRKWSWSCCRLEMILVSPPGGLPLPVEPSGRPGGSELLLQVVGAPGAQMMIAQEMAFFF